VRLRGALAIHPGVCHHSPPPPTPPAGRWEINPRGTEGAAVARQNCTVGLELAAEGEENERGGSPYRSDGTAGGGGLLIR